MHGSRTRRVAALASGLALGWAAVADLQAAEPPTLARATDGMVRTLTTVGASIIPGTGVAVGPNLVAIPGNLLTLAKRLAVIRDGVSMSATPRLCSEGSAVCVLIVAGSKRADGGVALDKGQVRAGARLTALALDPSNARIVEYGVVVSVPEDPEREPIVLSAELNPAVSSWAVFTEDGRFVGSAAGTSQGLYAVVPASVTARLVAAINKDIADTRAIREQEGSDPERAVAQYTTMIRERIRRYVEPPETTSAGTRVQVSFSISPDGEIGDVAVSRPSGSPKYDAAVVDGIRRASPLPPAKDSAVMERFRKVTMHFTHEK